MKNRFFFVLASLLILVTAAAQVTNPAPVFDSSSAAFPKSKAEFWTWGISLVTPVIVWLFGKIPQLPRPVLPVLTPFVGIGLGMLLRKLGQLNLSWVDMAQAGAVAVFIRESVNQLVTKQLKPLEASKTSAKPVDDAVAVKGLPVKGEVITSKNAPSP